MLAAFSACGTAKQTNSVPTDNTQSAATTVIPQNGAPDENADKSGTSQDGQSDPEDNELPADNSGITANTGDNKELLQSASVDLDADGLNEQVEAIKVILSPADGTTSQLEGRLKISDGNDIREVVFWNKDDDLSGIMTSLQFEDMDGDGAKDIFIVIPGYGASFTYSNCFIYSYMKDKSCISSSDNELADFIGGFRFAYENDGNKLSLINETYGFSTELTIEESDFAGYSTEDVMQDYADRSWIEPASVDISEASKLALVKNGSAAEIKVPFPIFGMATANMIGEVDLYYKIDYDFRLVMKRCEVIDFAGDEKVKAGSFDIKK